MVIQAVKDSLLFYGTTVQTVSQIPISFPMERDRTRMRAVLNALQVYFKIH